MKKKKKTGPAMGLFWIAPDPNYQPPPVVKGKPLPLRENRQRVIDGIRAKLKEAKGKAIRQDYSNGEFIVSSLIVGPSFESIRDRRLELDTHDYEAHYDKKLRLWWREGGFFD